MSIGSALNALLYARTFSSSYDINRLIDFFVYISYAEPLGIYLKNILITLPNIASKL